MNKIALLFSVLAGSSAYANTCADISGTYRTMDKCKIENRFLDERVVTITGNTCGATLSGTTTIVTPGSHPYDTCAMFVYNCSTFDGKSEEECAAEAKIMEQNGECRRSTITREKVELSLDAEEADIKLTRAQKLSSIGNCKIHSRIN